MNDNPLLELKDVCKSYDTSGTTPLRVLERISLSVHKEETVAITGPSGSGKSTLLNIIGTLDEPTSGSVIIDGRPIESMNKDQKAHVRSRKIGFIFQAHHLLPQCNVLENVLIPTIVLDDNGGSEELARRVLDYVGLSNRLNHLPSSLSVGECQRVAVARALINKPDIILADEPTGSLDHMRADSLASLLTQLNKEEKITIIAVTHSHRLADHMERQLILDNGTLEEA